VKFLKKLRKKSNLLGIQVSDSVSSFVGSWSFVFLYVMLAGLWIGLHKVGLLTVDDPVSFTGWTMVIGLFAGVQATMVLMSSSRQADQDRKRLTASLKADIKTLDLTEQNNRRIAQLTKQLSLLESLIDDFIGEQSNDE
jgi:uncharacterized membrane protein